MRLCSLICLICPLTVGVACDAQTPLFQTPIQPTLVQSPTPWPEGPTIEVGQAVEGRVLDGFLETSFWLTAPADGILVVRVAPNPEEGWPEDGPEDGWLVLSYDGRIFGEYGDAILVLRLPAIADVTYRLDVSYCCPWDYGVDVPFVLTASIE